MLSIAVLNGQLVDRYAHNKAPTDYGAAVPVGRILLLATPIVITRQSDQQPDQQIGCFVASSFTPMMVLLLPVPPTTRAYAGTMIVFTSVSRDRPLRLDTEGSIYNQIVVNYLIYAAGSRAGELPQIESATTARRLSCQGGVQQLQLMQQTELLFTPKRSPFWLHHRRTIHRCR